MSGTTDTARPHTSLVVTVAFPLASVTVVAKPLLGIYKLEGETLTICFAGPGDEERPKSFNPADGSRFMKMVLKRVKKKD